MPEESLQGIIFDIQEFAIHDGPGIRLVVFLKGCPLRCQWCHNPEGFIHDPQILRSDNGSERTVGLRMNPEELAKRLSEEMPLLLKHGGGVTFSGGEPLAQDRFIASTIALLPKERHLVLETSGYADRKRFIETVGLFDRIYFDLKLFDESEHIFYTGVSNASILTNFSFLIDTGKPVTVRIPLIPGVTDTRANMEGLAAFCAAHPGFEGIELMPYNKMAGGKYKGLGYAYHPDFDPEASPEIQTAIDVFNAHDLEVSLPC